jgi:Protein of unknown function (DUF4012)
MEATQTLPDDQRVASRSGSDIRTPGGRRRRRRRALWALVALVVLLSSFAIGSTAAAIPLLQLRSDLADAQRRVAALERLFSGGSALVSSPATLSRTLAEAQTQVRGIQHDLQAFDGVANLVGQPLGALSPTARNDELLLGMGNDLTGAADAALTAAQTVLQPLQGGVLNGSASPGLTPNEAQQVQDLVSQAHADLLDAVSMQQELDPTALPAQVRPGTHYGNLLAQLPNALSWLDTAQQFLSVAPGLLGIGQPAHYLVVLMDRSELRAGGGFQGNFGILTVQGARESQSQPLSLVDTYQLDQKYYQNPQYQDPSQCPADDGLTTVGPQPPDLYWWWPFRCFSNQFGWGLRDTNLSPDFPTNARTDMQIVEASGWLPKGTTLQGVIAFTPTLVEDVLHVTGPINMSAYHVTVTADNLEQEIHEFQLGASQPSQQDRKAFTHDLGAALLARLRHLSANQLMQLARIALQGLRDKDLQVYLNDNQAEQMLAQAGLAAQIHTGTGDGFFVTDTNDGGNKANTYVTEHQTDVVTLLPNGGALHRLQIAVTYDKQGSVYQGTTQFQDYSDIQRTYLPADASDLNYTMPVAAFGNAGCSGLYTWISDCTPGHRIDPSGSLTTSDMSGRAMVMEPFIVPCGHETSLIGYSGALDNQQCTQDPSPHTQTIYITWYTPNAYTANASGGGTYTELVEKQPGTTLSLPSGQPGSQVQLTVYISTSQETAMTDQAFAQIVAGAHKIYDAPLVTNTIVTYHLPGTSQG